MYYRRMAYSNCVYDESRGTDSPSSPAHPPRVLRAILFDSADAQFRSSHSRIASLPTDSHMLSYQGSGHHCHAESAPLEVCTASRTPKRRRKSSLRRKSSGRRSATDSSFADSQWTTDAVSVKKRRSGRRNSVDQTALDVEKLIYIARCHSQCCPYLQSMLRSAGLTRFLSRR